jgi:hypothetical protein
MTSHFVFLCDASVVQSEFASPPRMIIIQAAGEFYIADRIRLRKDWSHRRTVLCDTMPYLSKKKSQGISQRTLKLLCLNQI